jgi:hypothetical protein
VNEQGVKHYDDVIATMVALGIKPAVTLFHWGMLLVGCDVVLHMLIVSRYTTRTFQLVWSLD